jgi:hypothetical protein
LLPPGLNTADGNPISQNPIQAWLWKCWEQANAFIDTTCGADPFTLIVNGDLLEGLHHGSTQVISGDLGDHVNAALEVLKPLAAKAAQTHVVIGTEVHTRNTEAQIGKALNASKNTDTGRFAHDRLLLEFNGLRLSAMHHCSATSRQWLESGEYSRALGNERLSCIRAGWGAPDILLRAHRHVAGCFTDFGSMMCVTGAWQMQTRHTHKVVPGAVCEPGILILDARNRAQGELPDVRYRKYSPPEPRVVA